MSASPDLKHNKVATRVVQVAIPEEACHSQPHWLVSRNPGPYGCDVVHDTPGPAPAIRAIFEFETPDGVEIGFVKPVIYRWVDPSLGERTRPLAVVPPVTLAFASENRILPDSTPVEIPVRLQSNRGEATATVHLSAPDTWTVTPASKQVRFKRRGQELTAVFLLEPPSEASGGELRASVDVDGKTVRSGMRTIEYGHILATPVFQPAAMRVERLDLELLSKRIGYVMGGQETKSQAPWSKWAPT